MSKQFKVGDKVSWRSQAAGNYATKVGKITKVVPAGVRPIEDIGGCGLSRKHESYIVKAEASSTGRTRSYWPLVSLLKSIEEKADDLTVFDTETEPHTRTYTVKAKEGEDLRNLSTDELVERATLGHVQAKQPLEGHGGICDNVDCAMCPPTK